MLIEIGQLKSGDTYANGRYKVLSNEDGVIKIIRLSDKHYISFHDKSINWEHKVHKDG